MRVASLGKPGPIALLMAIPYGGGKGLVPCGLTALRLAPVLPIGHPERAPSHEPRG